MYSLKEKEEIIEQMKQGKTISELYKEYKISKTTLYKWQKEMLLRRKIKQLIQEGKLEEAKKEAEKLNGKNIEEIK
ncbi:MAG: helix-turn-helix domain-containing protein, partial [Clostridia bacterium]|nr:helix-turn-helix domain-containing protein [Clostridia bacterium]